jgi:hypothetical protein
MQRLALATIVISLCLAGGATASAQEPVEPIPPAQTVECAESDTRNDTNGDGIDDDCINFYLELDVDGIGPVCRSNAPFLRYDIVLVGAANPSLDSATITLRAIAGDFTRVIETDSLEGVILWPGAALGADGNATDWPGWRLDANGQWVIDPSDAFLRDGLEVTVEVNPTAVVIVDYPPADSLCADPPLEDQAGQGGGQGPGQGQIPTSGSETSLPLQIGAVLVLVGLFVVVGVRRRTPATTP